MGYRKEIMSYEKGKTYLVTSSIPLEIKVKTEDTTTTVSTLSPGSGVFCKSFTHDDSGDLWIRNDLGWIRATYGNIIYIS